MRAFTKSGFLFHNLDEVSRWDFGLTLVFVVAILCFWRRCGIRKYQAKLLSSLRSCLNFSIWNWSLCFIRKDLMFNSRKQVYWVRLVFVLFNLSSYVEA